MESQERSANRIAVQPLKRLIWQLGLPMVVSMILQAVYNIVDTVFVINMGEDGVAGNLALTYVFPIQLLMIAVGVGTGIGINALLAKNLGEGDAEGAARTAGNGIFLAVCLYAAFLLFGFFGAEWFVRLQANGNEQVIEMGTVYLRICCVFSFGSIGYAVYERFLQSTGKTAYSTAAQIMGALLNIVLDYVFIYPCGWGIAGAAWATVIGQIASLGIAMALHYGLNREIDGSPRYIRPRGGVILQIYRIGASGNLEVVTEGLAEIHSAPVLADDRYIYLVSYSSSDPIYQISLDGTIVATAECPSGVRNFNMIPLVVLGDTVFGGTDSGIYRFDGAFIPYVAPSNEQSQPLILIIVEVLAAVIGALAVVYAIMRFGKGIERPFTYLRNAFIHYLYGEDYTHNTRNKHRLKFIIVVGAVLTFAAFTLCLCVGSTSVQNPVEAYSALFSAIAKGGVGLDSLETTIYVSRLPRTIAALAVGIGLSVAGCVYQAIIRNPLVDPYIMGVSSGAGVAAIAVIAFDFTFFGMFSSHSIFLTAITACIGGLIAFGCTMLLAEKSGGSAINYVLSGVVVGLAFSAVQTIMLTMAGNKLSNALSWLYGSFAEVTWSQVGIVVFLSVFLSLVPLIWAKELNLVLLGEDQARQMGLDVRRFNRWMLILASVLTSVCVAFCGVIGFVGLVIPHLCRMLLGSDHRMVLPASICFGGVMLMLADLLARTGYYGMELPVGAITTVIGIPVFAYLLIKRGRMYDG